MIWYIHVITELNVTGQVLEVLADDASLLREAFPALVDRIAIKAFVTSTRTTIGVPSPSQSVGSTASSAFHSPSTSPYRRTSSFTLPVSQAVEESGHSAQSAVGLNEPVPMYTVLDPTATSSTTQNSVLFLAPDENPPWNGAAASPEEREVENILNQGIAGKQQKILELIKATPKGQEVYAEMMKKRTWTKAQRDFIIRTVGPYLMRQFAKEENKPTPDEKAAMANLIIDAFPFLEIPGRRTAAVYDRRTLKGPLETYCRGKRSRDASIETQPRKKKNTSVTPPATLEAAVIQMKRERPNTPQDVAQHVSLMEMTFQSRRDWISKESPSAADVILQYPRFYDTPATLVKEFQLMMGGKNFKTINETSTQLLSNLQVIVAEEGTAAMRSVVASENEGAFKNNPLFSTDPDALMIQLFYDDMATTNPLRRKSSKQSILYLRYQLSGHITNLVQDGIMSHSNCRVVLAAELQLEMHLIETI
ncbi:unnamed protein product [Cyprideis torosa]|uniref:Uncharacterized protein n=1 Tax=Cyprideis torosa TaxID=163714 RepID=A0A7R8WIL7_9CRUS|nr:unnamed protein product [Cyprideis torosa]CAG0900944.1 unnamed protein product [Cyprideis torosa]